MSLTPPSLPPSLQGEKIDVYLKALGIPFPESPKKQLVPKGQGAEPWFDEWSRAWGEVGREGGRE